MQWMLLDEAGNAIGAYGDDASAHAALRMLVAEEPEAARSVLLVRYDEDGHALGAAVMFDDLPETTVSLTNAPREVVVMIARGTIGLGGTRLADAAIARPRHVGTRGSSSLAPV